MATQWRRIERVPTDVRRRRSQKLAALSRQWSVEYETLRQRGVEREFAERMKNQMAIETGVLEGLYTLERGITETFIAEGFDSAVLPHAATDREPELVVAILRDQREAIDYVFELVKGDRPLSAAIIKELHQLLTRHQRTTSAHDQFGTVRDVPLLRGRWKSASNNPTRQDGRVHEYCPPEHVQSEIDRLLELYEQYVEDDVAPEILAAWLHHRFVQIHPFQDGNGRVARLLASIVFIARGWFPLVVLRDDRAVYIDALEQADAGDLAPLIELFGKWQSRSFLSALSASHKIGENADQHLDTVLASLRDKYHAPAQPAGGDIGDVAEFVLRVADKSLDKVATTTRQGLVAALPAIRVTTGRSDEDTAGKYRGPRIQLAKAAGFFADFARASGWARVIIRTTPGADSATILVSCTAVSNTAGSVAMTCGLVLTDTETRQAITSTVCEEPFLATVADLVDDASRADLEVNFNAWLDRCAVLALIQWRNS